MKNLGIIVLVIATLAMFASCSKENTSNESSVQLKIKSSNYNSGLKSTPADEIKLNEFFVNISEIEFDLDDDMEGLNDSIIDAQELKGPFLIDLLSPEAIKGLELGTTYIPNAKYEEIEFEFDIYNDETEKEVTGYSIYVSGTFNEIPFVIESDEEWELEVEFPDSASFSLNNENIDLYIDFNIQNIISKMNLIDFSSAKDLNGNGILEINPNNEDGNAELSKIIIEILSEEVDLDDENDDD